MIINPFKKNNFSVQERYTLMALKLNSEIPFPFQFFHFKPNPEESILMLTLFRTALSLNFLPNRKQTGIFDRPIPLFYCPNQKTEVTPGFSCCLILHFSIHSPPFTIQGARTLTLTQAHSQAHTSNVSVSSIGSTPRQNLKCLYSSPSPLHRPCPNHHHLGLSFHNKLNDHSILTAISLKFPFYTAV